ncbi:MAG: response regulator [Candidatus Korobacteraceae bacterium]
MTDALKNVLEPHCEVVGTVCDGRALLEAAAKVNPDLVVLDITMPQLNGLDAGRQLKAKMPNIRWSSAINTRGRLMIPLCRLAHSPL